MKLYETLKKAKEAKIRNGGNMEIKRDYYLNKLISKKHTLPAPTHNKAKFLKRLCKKFRK